MTPEIRDIPERLRGQAEAWRAAAALAERDDPTDAKGRARLFRHTAASAETQADRIDRKEQP